ncbi:hypothetical protein [Kribbella jejuensis]|uniref:hypothetical protein n=1 Tax=Kribbella jejuensis TaxID=236068 RepID=UPI001154EC47|nr:hypothetical protein [Kribbella jejuensis]
MVVSADRLASDLMDRLFAAVDVLGVAAGPRDAQSSAALRADQVPAVSPSGARPDSTAEAPLGDASAVVSPRAARRADSPNDVRDSDSPDDVRDTDSPNEVRDTDSPDDVRDAGSPIEVWLLMVESVRRAARRARVGGSGSVPPRDWSTQEGPLPAGRRMASARLAVKPDGVSAARDPEA